MKIRFKDIPVRVEKQGKRRESLFKQLKNLKGAARNL